MSKDANFTVDFIPKFQDLRSNVVEMSLKYITQDSLHITTQTIDPTSGKMSVSLLVKGSHWQPPFPSKAWKENTFELVSS